ncbi:MAG: hypothetical protein E6G15_09910 [Actinobacteria bacterium]|nr:MAG: hypothetical protein E6G15_09910 [Actinomycetota bacterium]
MLARLAYRAAARQDALWSQYAQELLAMAEELGLEELRAFVLMTIGTARGQAGEPGALEALEQAAEAADAIDSPVSIQTRINLAAQLQLHGELSHCFEVQARARRDAERFGMRSDIRHLRAELIIEYYWRGRWDEASREADVLLAEIEEGSPHPVGEIVVSCLRAHIRLARDDLEGALADGEQAVVRAREYPIWGYLAFALVGDARVLLAAGRSGEADPLVTEALELNMSDVAYAGLDLALAVVELGRADELLPFATKPYIWFEAAKALVAGDDVRAADLYAEIGSLPDEADARLHSGIESEVRRALDFYRSVGATRYIKEAEALLAASA